MLTRFTSLGLVIILALSSAPALAQDSEEEAPEMNCMQETVEKRELSLIGVFDVFHDTMVEALHARHNSLVTAWGQEDAAARKEMVKNAWGAFKSTKTAARKELRKSRRQTWKAFRQEAKACKGDVGSESESVDNF